MHDIPVGELRQDITTGDWVVISKARAQRPDDFVLKKEAPKTLPKFKKNCPFCEQDRFPQFPDVLRLPDDDERWQVHIFGNKYPAFIPKDDFKVWEVGPYRTMEAVGYHEVLATRWHNEIEGVLTEQQLQWQIEALVLRYRQLRTKPSVNYIQIIKNHGQAAGGSLEHPHHQIFTVPVLPSDIRRMLVQSEAYAHRYGKSAFEVMVQFEQHHRERMVLENEHFVAFCPYASRVPFETWIMPKKHSPFFENIGPDERLALSRIMHDFFKKLYHGLNNPSYNYYIHSAPCDDSGFVCDKEQFKHFRWHIEIMPRLSTFGGFELGTGIEICSALPEESATFLREQPVSVYH